MCTHVHKGRWYGNDLLGAKEFKDAPGGIPKSDLLGVTVARVHVAGQ